MLVFDTATFTVFGVAVFDAMAPARGGRPTPSPVLDLFVSEVLSGETRSPRRRQRSRRSRTRHGRTIRVALNANPRQPDYRQFYRNNLWALVDASAGLLDQAGAVRAAETIRDLGWDPPGNAYDAACALALCIPSVTQHEQLDAGQRQAAVQFYGDQALALLRNAVAKGFKDVTKLKKDTALAPLRPRADFQKLLAELEGKEVEKK